jgi:hypothetical protein
MSWVGVDTVEDALHARLHLLRRRDFVAAAVVPGVCLPAFPPDIVHRDA